MEPLERDDIQGLLLSAYGDLSCAAYVLLRVVDRSAGRRWLAGIADEITPATGLRDPSINVALTYRGLGSLGLDRDVLASFPHAFRDGMASERRSRLLGDTGDSAPANWDWGGPNNEIDILLMVFTSEPDELEEQVARRRDDAVRSGGMEEVLTLRAGRRRDARDTTEHFGFNDGIGQPVIEGSGSKERQFDRTGHATELKPGEFILGYTDTYGRPAPSPMVDPARDPKRLLPSVRQPAPLTGAPSALAGVGKRLMPARRDPAAAAAPRDLGRNGTYLVFRQIAQHVAEFWKFLDEASGGPDGQGGPDAAVRLGAKIVGRWPSGAPLVKYPLRDPFAGRDELTNENDFEYADRDPHGFACPIGSHIRRSNPRDSLGPNREAALASARRHRILRRGRPYGDRPADPRVDDRAPRGLLFICLNSDIERQFEFIQQTWINNRVFAGLYNESDPLIGNQDRTARIATIQQNPLRTRVAGLRPFLTVRGGAYFFLPGRTALRYLGSLGDEGADRHVAPSA